MIYYIFWSSKFYSFEKHLYADLSAKFLKAFLLGCGALKSKNTHLSD